MLNPLIKITLVVACLGLRLALAEDEPPVIGTLALSPQDRILVLAPHPDDEVLGVGGVLQRAVSLKLPIKVVFLTNGDSNQWSFMVYRKHPVVMPKAVQQMGLIRRDEALAAADVLGVGRSNLVFLGYPDFGTLNMWNAHWHHRPPYRSLLTRVRKVPYQGALRPGAFHKGEDVVADLRTVLREFKPTKVFVSHPADHNGDHLSAYLFLRVALWDEQMDVGVRIFPYLIHYLGWPKPQGFHPDKPLTPPKALARMAPWVQFHLTEEEFDRKKDALKAHKSQYGSTPKYLLSFIRHNELFGDFPLIHLHPKEDSSVFSLKHKVISRAELPDEFNDREKSSFIGVEWKFVRWEDDRLIVSIELSKPLAQDVEASMYFFGYKKTVPFEQMPKISVKLGVLSYTVYDQNKRIAQESVMVNRAPKEITISVPLGLLGHPGKILTSARTYLGNVPLDSAAWVALELVD